MPSGSNDDDARAPTELAPTEAEGAQTLPRGDGPVVVERHSIGRFRIDAGLGSGGMADVYRAYDPVLDRAVALKVLHTKRSPGDTQGMRRVLREARAAAALTHPNTVTIFEVGEADGEVFIAMELLQGSVMRDVMDRHEGSLEEKLRWLLQAARALAAAHERGLVHRDVKPENMFVCSDGTLKLLDFGIAKRDDDDGEHADSDHTGPSSLRTQAGRRLGTPRYMAPEQHAGLATDGRTDQYAWGLVAFELLCGSHVVAEQPTVTMEGGAAPDGASAAMRLAELRAKVPELREDIAKCIARALEPKKEDRALSMDLVIGVLEPKARTEALPPPPARTRAPLVAVAALLCVGGLFGLAKLREHPSRQPIAKLASELPPMCRTIATRTLALGKGEGMTVMTNGGLVFVHPPKEGLVIERETPDGGRASLQRYPMPASEGFALKKLWLRGVARGKVPAVLVVGDHDEVNEPDPRTTLFLVGEDLTMSMRPIRGSSRGIAATTFEDGIVALVATGQPNPREQIPAGANLHILGSAVVIPIESGDTVFSPAIGRSATRLGVAYQYASETHFALLDRDLKRVGDVMTALPFPTHVAIGFAGSTVVLFWTDSGTKKLRLYYTTFTPGDAAFSAPREAIDEPLLDEPPFTIALPDGSSAVAWLASKGGPPTLRVSPIGAGGALTGPSSVVTEATVRHLDGTPTIGGIDFSWTDGAGTGRVLQVQCQPPTSLPDR